MVVAAAAAAMLQRQQDNVEHAAAAAAPLLSVKGSICTYDIIKCMCYGIIIGSLLDARREGVFKDDRNKIEYIA